MKSLATLGLMFLVVSAPLKAQDSAVSLKEVRTSWAQNLKSLADFARHPDRIPVARNAANGHFRDIVCRSGFDCHGVGKNIDVQGLIELNRDFFNKLVGIFNARQNGGADRRWEQDKDKTWHEHTRIEDYESALLFQDSEKELGAVIARLLEFQGLTAQDSAKIESEMKQEVQELYKKVPAKVTMSGHHMNPLIPQDIAALAQQQIEKLNALVANRSVETSADFILVNQALKSVMKELSKLATAPSKSPWMTGDYQIALIVICGTGEKILNSLEIE